MSLCALRRGNRVKIGASEFLLLQRLPEDRWQLQNSTTGEWCIFDESDLLDRFTRNELSFVPRLHGCDLIAANWPRSSIAIFLVMHRSQTPPAERVA
jgi:hypothetical protein